MAAKTKTAGKAQKDQKGFHINLLEEGMDNKSKMKKVYESPDAGTQVVLMHLKPKQVIPDEGLEKHNVDQTVYCIKGIARVKVGTTFYKLKKQQMVVIPAGEKHYIKNSSGKNPLWVMATYNGKVH